MTYDSIRRMDDETMLYPLRESMMWNQSPSPLGRLPFSKGSSTGTLSEFMGSLQHPTLSSSFFEG